MSSGFYFLNIEFNVLQLSWNSLVILPRIRDIQYSIIIGEIYYLHWPSLIFFREFQVQYFKIDGGSLLSHLLRLILYTYIIHTFDIKPTKYCRRESYIATDGQSASHTWHREPIWDPKSDCYYYLLRVYWYVVSSLMRGRFCRLQLLLVLARAIKFAASEL
jgi:hypothetical protein